MRKALTSLALSVPQVRRVQDDRLRLYGEVAGLQHEVARLQHRIDLERSPFFHYHACFDAEATIARHAVPGLEPAAGVVTNFLGVRVDPRVAPERIAGTEGTVEGIPIPANWHADIAEWAAVLRAVELAGDRFRMIELGCGWGCWMANAGAAARRAGKAVELTGVEADAGHVALARATLAENGFGAGEVRLLHGIAAETGGRALFPRRGGDGDVAYDVAPVLSPSALQLADAEAVGTYDVLDVVGLAELAGPEPVDLLHVDIQGGEADLIDACATTLRERVRYLVLGTHSRVIEGRLMARLADDGWRLEIERPAILSLDDGEPGVVVDGVQGWRSPALTSPGAPRSPA